MAKDHWQVVKRVGNGAIVEGGHETLDVKDVPTAVLSVAVQAARAVGSSLYGVDLKQFGKRVKVIEVNDNPNLDHGVEDLVLKDVIYEKIMAYFLKRLEARTRTCHRRRHVSGLPTPMISRSDTSVVGKEWVSAGTS